MGNSSKTISQVALDLAQFTQKHRCFSRNKGGFGKKQRCFQRALYGFRMEEGGTRWGEEYLQRKCVSVRPPHVVLPIGEHVEEQTDG